MTTETNGHSISAIPAHDRAADRLFGAALAIVSAPTLEAMLRETTERAAQIIGANQAVTILLMPETSSAITTTHVTAGPGDTPSGTQHVAARFERRGTRGEVIRTNEPLLLTHRELELRPDWYAMHEERLTSGAEPLRGLLAVPLIGHQGVNLGLIELSDRVEGDFGAEDRHLLQSLAQFTAMAIEQLRLSADLAYQSSLTRTVAENATSGLMLMNTTGQVTYMNSAGARIIGYDLGSLGGRRLHDVVHHTRSDGTPVSMAECRIWRTVLGEEQAVTPFEDAFIRPDGSFYPVRIAAAPVMRDAQVVAVVLEVQDITAEETVAGRLSDLAVSASDRAAKLRGLIQSIGDAVVVCEPAGEVSLMNPAAVTLFGPRLTHMTELVARLRAQDGTPLEPGAPIGGSYLVHAAEHETWVEARAFPVPPAAGWTRREGRVADAAQEGSTTADHGTIYVFRDVTATRRAKVMREAFIGMLSHELRTPITTVYGGTKVLARRSEQLLPEVRSVVADIEAELERLFRLVEDLVVLTKSEAATLEAGREPVLLQRVLPGLVTAEARRWPTLQFGVECWSSMPPVLAEQTYLEQVVRNLLTNAAKYGGSKEPIVVTGTSEGDEVVVRVLDRGPGFPEGDGDRLFDIYYRSPHVARRAAGAGIGLFVCKSLVDVMGGRIWARERQDGGAEFGFALKALVEPGDGDDREFDA